MNKRVAGLIFVVVLSVASATAMDRAHFIELNKKGRELAQKQDWKGLREVLIEIRREMPGATPRFLLRMASVETHLGNKAEALRWLEQYASMGLSYDVAADDDLKPLLAEEGFKKIAAQMAERTKPLANAELVCTLPQADVMPEDIAYVKASNTFIVSSIQHHGLYRVSLPKPGTKECTMQELPLAEEAKRWPSLAVSGDAKRKVLWMTESAMSGFTGFPKEDEGKALLMEVDAASGKILRRFDPATGGPAVLGDMSVTADGIVYVTASTGGVYRLHGELPTAKLEKIADGLISPQTPVLARDGKLNYLLSPDNVATTGLDGLYLSGDWLIGIQNGTEPERIVRFHLNHAQTEIIAAEVIEQSSPRLGDPTHAVAVDGWFYVSANVGWNKLDDAGKLKQGENFTAPVLLRFPTERSPTEPRQGR